jgi:hypothetical protein
MENLGHLDCVQAQWKSDIVSSITTAHDLISNSWTTLSRTLHANIDTGSLCEVDAAREVNLELPVLDTFLTAIAMRLADTGTTVFEPGAEFPTFEAGHLPMLSGRGDDQKFFYLAAFETWVQKHLASWLATNLAEEGACEKLRNSIRTYHSIASTVYTGVPASLSIMYMTILELWVACDKSACHIYSLLRKYGPEVQLSELQCLVLPLRCQLERLSDIELYVKSREDRANRTLPSIFHDFGHTSTFAVQYFDQSSDLQNLKSEIERTAERARRDKLEELDRLKQQYRKLMECYDRYECETHEVLVNHYHGYTETQHKPDCAKCAFKRSAEALEIDIHEWPLSSKTSAAKATVFELRVPEAFSNWRDATIYVLVSVLGYRDTDSSRPQYQCTLDKHHGLAHMLSAGYQDRRVVPLSSVKAHTGTHRKHKESILHVQEKDVCLPNALRYEYFDSRRAIYINRSEPTGHLVNECMYRMPDASSAVLERFMSRPPTAPDGVQPNVVIADLVDCPAHLSLDEYKALGTLSLGQNIIYSNILTQLANPVIDFAKPETQTLLLQSIGQVGAPASDGDARRISHSILCEADFGYALLEQIHLGLARIEENWEAWRACATFVALSRRVLSLTSSQKIRDRILHLLGKSREIAMRWLRRLQDRAAASTNDEQRHELYSRATEIALLCTSTFDVDDEFVGSVLEQSSAVSALIQSSIMVQQNCLAVEFESDKICQIMLQAWAAMTYRIVAKLRQQILRYGDGLNDAVIANWAAFRPPTESGWSMVDDAHGHWLHTRSDSLPVHYNLLTGELLVNGLPLARLPPDYMEHETYRSLFRCATLEVVPSGRPGMKFSAKSKYHNHELHFAMSGADMHLVALSNGET